MNAFDVIGYAYEADEHCPDCAQARYGNALEDGTAEDSEGNEPSPIFGDHKPGDPLYGCFCGTCGEVIVEGTRQHGDGDPDGSYFRKLDQGDQGGGKGGV